VGRFLDACIGFGRFVGFVRFVLNKLHDLGDGEFDDAFGDGEVLVGSPERSVVWESVPGRYCMY
jgi:hypothetical protein